MIRVFFRLAFRRVCGVGSARPCREFGQSLFSARCVLLDATRTTRLRLNPRAPRRLLPKGGIKNRIEAIAR